VYRSNSLPRLSRIWRRSATAWGSGGSPYPPSRLRHGVRRFVLPAALAVIIAPPAARVNTVATAQAPGGGTWLPAASMPFGRWSQTTALLADGRVLVAGGEGCAGTFYCSSAAIYDPASGRWTATQALPAPRGDANAVRLSDGRVLVTGGFPAATPELFDPVTGTWSAAGGHAQEVRFGATTTLLPDGRVLVVGGGLHAVLASAEVYDVRANQWHTVRSMLTPHLEHTATALPDGSVLVAGGESPKCLPIHICRSAELYDARSGAWRRTGDMSVPREEQTATLLPSGQVLTAGGYGCAPLSVCSAADLYDPASGTWTPTGRMVQARAGHTATLLPDGDVLVTGGYGCTHERCAHLSSAELYDPGTGSWREAGSMRHAREYHSATLLPSGQAFVVGGSSRCTGKMCVPNPSTEVYVNTGPRSNQSLSSNQRAPMVGQIKCDMTIIHNGGLPAGPLPARGWQLNRVPPTLSGASSWAIGCPTPAVGCWTAGSQRLCGKQVEVQS
jgi:N-acetylneuraminic acid mutarotase